MGRIKKRADGRYLVQVYTGAVDGARRYKSVYGATLAEAERKAADIRAKMRAGERIDAGDRPVKEWSDRLLEKKEPDVAPIYFKGLTGRCSWWCKRIGDVPVSKVLVSDIEDGIRDLKNDGKSKKTITEYRNTIRAVLEIAERDRAITYNPARWADIPKSAPQETRFALTERERGWIDTTEHRAQTAAMIMLYAGLRRGELLALTVGDIDFRERTITVNKSVYFDGNTPIVKRGGKTDAATRVIPLPDVLARYLQSALRGMTPLQLVVSTDGKHMTESAFTRMWESYICVLNEQHGQEPGEHRSRFSPGGLKYTIRNITPHVLRHTYATMLHAAGVDVLMARKMMGHSDIKTTLSIYTHLDETTEKKDIKKLDNYLTGLSL